MIDEILTKLKRGESITPEEADVYRVHYVNLARAAMAIELRAFADKLVVANKEDATRVKK